MGTLSEAIDVLWDECGEHLEAEKQYQDSKTRSNMVQVLLIYWIISIA